MKTKMPIAWHEENLKNLKIYLARKEQQLKELMAEVETSKIDVERRQRQIDVAKRRNLDGFDADKFLQSEFNAQTRKHETI